MDLKNKKILITGATGGIGNTLIEKFNNLNEILKFLTVQSFYYEYRYLLLKKQIRDENIRNFIKILKAHLKNSKDLSVFSGKIGVINKKICINLT